MVNWADQGTLLQAEVPTTASAGSFTLYHFGSDGWMQSSVLAAEDIICVGQAEKWHG